MSTGTAFAPPAPRRSALSQGDWDMLLKRIARGDCTPFVGSELCAGILPSASEIAQSWASDSKNWADDFEYPLPDSKDLSRVAQCIAAMRDEKEPRDRMRELLSGVKVADDTYDSDSKPFGILAALPFPIYVTTTYDDLLFQGLKSRAEKDAKRSWCQWKDMKDSPDADPDASPAAVINVANPLVFHLYGHVCDDLAEQSMVLTEDDYLEFLQQTSKYPDLIPPRIHKAFGKASLLFLGYQPMSTEFRVLLRSLSTFLKGQAKHVSVQVITEQEIISAAHLRQAEEYLSHRYRSLNVTMCWVDTREFLTELKQRWDAVPADTKQRWRA